MNQSRNDSEKALADMLIQACQKLHEAEGMIDGLGRPDLAREFGSLARSLRQTMFDLEDMARNESRRRIVTELEQTCTACPSQWEGRTADGSYLYIRYRHGHLSVYVDGDPVFALDHGDGLDGMMSTAEMQRLTPCLSWEESLC